MNLRKLQFCLSVAIAFLTCLTADVKPAHTKGSPMVGHFCRTSKGSEHRVSKVSSKLHSTTPNSVRSESNKSFKTSTGHLNRGSTSSHLNDKTISVSAETVSKKTDTNDEDVDLDETEFADKSAYISVLYDKLMNSIYRFLSHNKSDREKRNKVNSTAIIEPRDDTFKSVLNGAAGFLTYLIDDLGQPHHPDSDKSVISKNTVQLVNKKPILDRRQFNPFVTTTTLISYDYLEHYGDEYFDEDSYVIETSSSIPFDDEVQESPAITEIMNYFGAKYTDSNDQPDAVHLKDPGVELQKFPHKDTRPINKPQAARKSPQASLAKSLSDEHIIELIDQEISKVLEVLKEGLNIESIMNRVKSSRTEMTNTSDDAMPTDEFNKIPFFRNRVPLMGQENNRKEKEPSDIVIVRNGKLLDGGKVPAARRNHYKYLYKSPASNSFQDLKGPLREREKSEYFWQLYKPECRLKNRIRNQFHFPSQNNNEGQLSDNAINEEDADSQSKSKQDISPVKETSKAFTVTNKQLLLTNYSTEKSAMKKSNVNTVSQRVQATIPEAENTPTQSSQEFVTIIIPASDIKDLLTYQIEKKYRKLTTENPLKPTKKFFYFKRRDSTTKVKPTKDISKNVMFLNQLGTDIDTIGLNKRYQDIPVDKSELYYLPTDEFVYELSDKSENIPGDDVSKRRLQLEPNLDYGFINRFLPKSGKLTKKTFLDYGDSDYSLLRKQLVNNDIIRNFAEDKSKGVFSYANSNILNQKGKDRKCGRNNPNFNYKNKEPHYQGHFHSHFRQNKIL